MRARIVPRFETRRAIYSALIRGYIYLKRARFVETKPIGRIFSPRPLSRSVSSFRLISSFSPLPNGTTAARFVASVVGSATSYHEFTA